MFALFEVSQLRLVPLSCVWTLLIYPQTEEQVNPAQQRQAGTFFFFFFFFFFRTSGKNVFYFLPKQKAKKKNPQKKPRPLKLIVLYTGPVGGAGVALNLSKTCRLLRISVYAPWREQRLQQTPRGCQSLLPMPHTSRVMKVWPSKQPWNPQVLLMCCGWIYSNKDYLKFALMENIRIFFLSHSRIRSRHGSITNS